MTVLMWDELRPLLPRQEYSNLMGQLEEAFRPYRQAGGAANAAAAAATSSQSMAWQLQQLQVMYRYLQAAVDGRQLSRVVAAVNNLISVACPST